MSACILSGRSKIIALAFIFFFTGSGFAFAQTTAGLVGQWSFDEGTGVTAADGAGNASATLGSTASWLSGTSCHLRNCISLNGTASSLLTVPYVAAHDFDASSFSYSGWIYITDTSRNNTIID